MRSTTLFSLGIALVLPMCANSNKQHGPVRSQEELDAAFKRKDTNNDGFLSRDEFAANARDPGKSVRTFIKKDTSADGKLTKQEFCARIARYH